MTILDPDVAHASASLIAAHKRVVKDKNRTINDLQARNGELQRALQAKSAEVVRCKMQAVDALGEAIAAYEPRPLTPDAITDEMVRRALDATGCRQTVVNSSTVNIMRQALTAALTEPPKRPEGAERWEDFLIDSLDYQALTDQQIADLADRIAEVMNR